VATLQNYVLWEVILHRQIFFVQRSRQPTSVFQSKRMTLKLVAEYSLRTSISSYQMTRNNFSRYSSIQQKHCLHAIVTVWKSIEIWIIFQTTDNRIFDICRENNILLPLSYFKSSESHLFSMNRCTPV